MSPGGGCQHGGGAGGREVRRSAPAEDQPQARLPGGSSLPNPDSQSETKKTGWGSAFLVSDLLWGRAKGNKSVVILCTPNFICNCHFRKAGT